MSMGNDEQKQINDLNINIANLDGKIQVLNNNFDNLNKQIPKLLDKIEHQTKFMLDLIEKKDAKYNSVFVRKDINDKENLDFEKRVCDLESDRKKLTWAVISLVIMAVMNLIIK